MDAQLKVLSGPFAGRVIPVTKSRYVIGRELDCDCRLNDESVSRRHCVLMLDDRGLRVRDLRSKNGTLVNRSRIGTGDVFLSDGDVLGVGF